MYSRPLRKKRTAFFDDPVWVEVFERGKRPRPDFECRADRTFPPADVSDLLMQAQLTDLLRRLEVLMCAMQRPKTSTSANGSSASSVSQCELLAAFSELWDFLTRNSYSDGTSRTTGQMSVKLGSGGLQVTLTDPTSATYCCLTATSLQDAFLGLEIGLKDGSLAWRPSGYAKEQKRKN
jgi:hypothetical protein